MRRRSLALAAVLALCAAGGFAASAVVAQTARGVPNALQGFSENRGKP